MKLTIKKHFAAITTALVLLLLVFSPRGDTLQPPPSPAVQDSAALTHQAAADSFPSKITQLFVNGNRVTRSDIIRMYVGLDTGMTYDSVLAAAGKRRLLNTNLFSRVDVVALRKPDGVHVYIIVTELFYVYPEGGGDYIFGKYGDTTPPIPLWYRLRLGLTIQNFRGALETFSIHTSIWEDRSLSASWSKPLLPSPYTIGVGAGVRDYPEINFPRRRLLINGRVSGARTLFDNSRVYLSFSPTYTRIDSVNDDANVKHLKELYTALGWSTDRRDRSYDPVNGWYFCGDAFTNALYAGDYNRYVQFNTDLRLYHRGPFCSDHLAFRLQTVLRPNDAGPYRGLYMGGDGSIRGFWQDELGRSGPMNDYAMLSTEYRFPLWTLPCFDIWLLSDYSDMLKSFFARLDGAVFVDAGNIWHDIGHPWMQHEDGVGIGAGLRAMLPTLRRSVCFDVAWGAIPRSAPARLAFLSCPNYYLYLDLYY
jgi:outer membrane protein assembly factor BamA